MGYQALLFCPDEKTARTVTQVLSELEFAVESCTEPFAAVKKLMAEHFDAVVVDCDNEQNATLLFKSARNSTSNQTSLAVAVVEGQAGVAKAFRIGANLVLTKPINVEQAKGTLRVARGLLRKGDPAKPAAAPSTQSTTPAKTAGPATSTPPRPPLGAPVQRPVAPASVAGQAASAKVAIPTPAAQTPDPFDADVLDVDDEAPVAPAAFKGAPSQAFAKTSAPTAGVKPSGSIPAAGAGSTAASGAASAAAPARVGQAPEFESASESTAVAKTLDFDHAGNQAPDSSAPAPTFTFGGANAPEPSSGAGKKALIGVAALVIVVGLYFGWTHFHGRSATPSPVAEQTSPASTITPQNAQPSKAHSTSPSSPASSANPVSSPSAEPSALSKSAVEKPETDLTTDDSEDAPAKSANSTRNSVKGAKTGSAADAKSPSESKSAPETKPDSQPIMVKKGMASPAQTKSAPAADAPAPSVLGIAAAGSDSGLPDLVANENSPQPVLQTLNVSQGVSQGLLIKRVQPTYPPTALRMHVEGAVQLMATIGKNGSITAVKVLNGEPILSKAALDAVRQWKYKPYFLNGEPVEIQTQITVNFKLPR
jgi:TonB family protein